MRLRRGRTIKLVARQQVVPQLLDLGHLGEEAVPADVEAPAVAHDGPADPADDVVALDDDRRDATLGEPEGCGEPGGAGADDHDIRRMGVRGVHGTVFTPRCRDPTISSARVTPRPTRAVGRMALLVCVPRGRGRLGRRSSAPPRPLLPLPMPSLSAPALPRLLDLRRLAPDVDRRGRRGRGRGACWSSPASRWAPPRCCCRPCRPMTRGRG